VRIISVFIARTSDVARKLFQLLSKLVTDMLEELKFSRRIDVRQVGRKISC
jgi:hypothetical protein